MKANRVLAGMLALLLAVSVTACGRRETQEQDTSVFAETNAQETESTETDESMDGTEEYRGFLMDICF